MVERSGLCPIFIKNSLIKGYPGYWNVEEMCNSSLNNHIARYGGAVLLTWISSLSRTHSSGRGKRFGGSFLLIAWMLAAECTAALRTQLTTVLAATSRDTAYITRHCLHHEVTDYITRRFIHHETLHLSRDTSYITRHCLHHVTEYITRHSIHYEIIPTSRNTAYITRYCLHHETWIYYETLPTSRDTAYMTRHWI